MIENADDEVQPVGFVNGQDLEQMQQYGGACLLLDHQQDGGYVPLYTGPMVKLPQVEPFSERWYGSGKEHGWWLVRGREHVAHLGPDINSHAVTRLLDALNLLWPRWLPAAPAPLPARLVKAVREVLRISDRQHVAWDEAKAALAEFEAGQPAAQNQAPAEAHEPLFWYRPCGDGLYEGPVHHKSVGGKMLRDEKPGEWVPLFPGAHPQPKHAACEYCNGTGDVHGLDGEWRGECNQCPAAAQAHQPDASAAVDARRYRRLQILGAAPFGSKNLDNGTVLRFQSLDAFVDADIEAHPSRGESAQPEAAPNAQAGQAPAPAPEAPTGYKLVPVEPTPQMRKAAADAWLDCDSKLILNKAASALRAGIAAAPKEES